MQKKKKCSNCTSRKVLFHKRAWRTTAVVLFTSSRGHFISTHLKSSAHVWGGNVKERKTIARMTNLSTFDIHFKDTSITTDSIVKGKSNGQWNCIKSIVLWNYQGFILSCVAQKGEKFSRGKSLQAWFMLYFTPSSGWCLKREQWKH